MLKRISDLEKRKPYMQQNFITAVIKFGEIGGFLLCNTQRFWKKNSYYTTVPWKLSVARKGKIQSDKT